FVNGVAIVTDAFAGTGQLGKGIALNQVAINAGTITGYTLSGILIFTPVIGWRSMFLVNVPVGIFGTYWSKKRLHELSRPSREENFDILGAITFSAAITSLLLGLTIGSLTSPSTTLLLSISLTLIIAFLWIERHTKSPVIDLSIFKIRVFTTGNLSNLFSGLAFASLAFVMTLYFQLIRGFDPYTAGLALVPLEATLLLVGPISGTLSDKYGARGLSTIGLVIASIGFILMSTIQITTSYLQIAIWFSFVGLGIGFFRSPNASSVMGAVSPQRRGIASGIRVMVLNTSIVGSIPFATAMITTVVPYETFLRITSNSTITALQEKTLLLNGLRVALVAFAVVNLIAASVSALRGSSGPRADQENS
ncbi:MAG TPA: MFS transporter, partial [Candidatus Binatus sp.]|nr:MFS transporter [Candidatus Binatus sp.]